MCAAARQLFRSDAKSASRSAGRLAAGGLVLVLACLAGFAAFVAIKTGSSGAEVRRASAVSDAYQHVGTPIVLSVGVLLVALLAIVLVRHRQRVERELRSAEERKRAEQTLRETNETLRSVIDAAPLAVMALDANGIVRMWNRAAEEIFGWREQEVIGKFNPILPQSARAEFQALLKRVLRGESLRSMELVRQRKDGSPVDVTLSTAPMRDAEGNVIATIGVLDDISGRKQAEEALRRSEEQLRQSQRLEAVGQLAGGIAHDFNNLLTAISGYCGFLLESLNGDERRSRGYAEEIKKAAERAARLTNQLLAFSRKQVLRPRVVSLNEVVSGLESMLRRVIGEDIELVTVCDPALRPVRADPGQLEQVLMNLVVNARDAMPEGGELRIETANVELAGPLEGHPHITPGSYVRLSVRDTGAGMDAETRDRIFEPFFTTKEEGRGTGLGLATVYGIVKQSGGYIYVDSEPGRGATADVYLPQAAGAVESRAPSAPPSRPSTGSETVLLVEDEEAVRRLVKTVLEQSGYTVLEASSGSQALAVSERHEGAIDLLLTDVVMPGMNGRELAERLTEARPSMSVLFTSGYTEDGVVQHGVVPHGVVPGRAFVQKPFSAAILAAKVREVLDRVDRAGAPQTARHVGGKP